MAPIHPHIAILLPSFPAKLKLTKAQEAPMTRIVTLLAKFGLLRRKDTAPDAFDMRLTRIGTRESRRTCRVCGLFRNPL